MSIVPTKILVATDDFKDAHLAVGVALDLSERTGAELHVVHAWRKPQALPLARPGLAYPYLEAISHPHTCEREAEELLEEQVGMIRDAGRRRKRRGGTPEGWAPGGRNRRTRRGARGGPGGGR